LAIARAFNAAPGPKVLAVLSPHCQVCAGVAEVLHATTDAAVFVTWIPAQRFDGLRGLSTQTLARVPNARAQAWDSGGVVAAELCRAEARTSTACEDSGGTLWGWVGVWPAGVEWGSWPTAYAFDPDMATLQHLLGAR
jgi:hypothetical protein